MLSKQIFKLKQMISKTQEPTGSNVNYFCTCWFCDGDGKVFHEDKNRWVICPKCNGDGSIVEIEE